MYIKNMKELFFIPLMLSIAQEVAEWHNRTLARFLEETLCLSNIYLYWKRMISVADGQSPPSL